MGEKIYLLKELPTRKEYSKEFDEPIKEPVKKAHHIPPLTHPWKKASFDKFVKSQKHRTDDKEN